MNFQVYSGQPVEINLNVPAGGSQSGVAEATYAEGGGRSAGAYTCWQTPGCDSYYGCQTYQVGTPIFAVLRQVQGPLPLPVTGLDGQ